MVELLFAQSVFERAFDHNNLLIGSCYSIEFLCAECGKSCLFVCVDKVVRNGFGNSFVGCGVVGGWCW